MPGPFAEHTVQPQADENGDEREDYNGGQE
jgi:hypothetical protein